MTLDVKALAALPGFGAAERALRKELGPFYGATGPTRVSVTVHGTYCGPMVYRTSVEATSTSEALRLAKDIAAKASASEWECKWGQDVDVEDAELGEAI